MKRIILVLALALIFTLSLVGGAIALDRPYVDPWNPGGEEHPWGGDEVVIDPPPITKYDSPTSFSTGYTVLDVVLNYFVMDELTRFRVEEYKSRRNEILEQKRFFRKNYSSKEVIR